MFARRRGRNAFANDITCVKRVYITHTYAALSVVIKKKKNYEFSEIGSCRRYSAAFSIGLQNLDDINKSNDVVIR